MMISIIQQQSRHCSLNIIRVTNHDGWVVCAKKTSSISFAVMALKLYNEYNEYFSNPKERFYYLNLMNTSPQYTIQRRSSPMYRRTDILSRYSASFFSTLQLDNSEGTEYYYWTKYTVSESSEGNNRFLSKPERIKTLVEKK